MVESTHWPVVWTPNCYAIVQNVLPTPIVSIEVNGTQGIYIAPDLLEFVPLVGEVFTGYYDSINFDWQRLAGAKVLQIEGQDAYDYVDFIAKTEVGTYLDHGVRVNAVFSSYTLSGTDFSYQQSPGILAEATFPERNNLTFSLITVNSTQPENVTVPHLAFYGGAEITDSQS
jgi:hypothetical protein